MPVIPRTKFDLVYELLIREVNESFNIGDIITPEAQLAARFGVNRNTVAKVIAVMVKQGIVTRKAGYGTVLLKKIVEHGKDSVITVLPSESAASADPYFFRLFTGVHTAASKISVINTVFPCSGDEGRETITIPKLLSLYDRSRHHGIIIANPNFSENERWRSFFKTENAPASVWPGYSGPLFDAFNCVDTDNYDSTAEVVRMFFQRGYKKIAFVSEAPRTHNMLERKRAFIDAHLSGGVSLDERFLICPAGKNAAETGARAFSMLCRLNADAVFVGGPEYLEGARFLPPPERSAVSRLPAATFDCPPENRILNIRIAVMQPVEKIGERALEILLAVSAGPLKAPRHEILKNRIALL
jgi:DNA-binding LacI/PurR family transcriptional regulator